MPHLGLAQGAKPACADRSEAVIASTFLNRAARRRFRQARATGVTTVLTVGALASVLVAPNALAETGSSSPVQAQIDQIIAAQQQITATNSAYPFITAYDKTLLPDYVKEVALDNLYLQLNQVNYDNNWTQNAGQLPYAFNASGTDPLHTLNTPNPDDAYNLVTVGEKTETITITPKPGTEDVTFTLMSGTGITTNFVATKVYDLTQFTPDANGTYTITLSPTAQSGNWVDTSGAQTLLLRDTIGNWGEQHDAVTFQPSSLSSFTLPILSNSAITSILSSIASSLTTQNSGTALYGLQQKEDTLPVNQFTPIRQSTAVGGPILPSQYQSLDHFNLQPGQALVVKVPAVQASYSGFQLNDAWSQDAPFATVSGSLNNTQAFHDADGYTYYVLSATDPGVANWIDTSGMTDGNVWMRWQDVTGTIPTEPITTQVVNVADVKSTMPADTPTVTAAQRTADLKQRLFNYDYRADQSKNLGWVSANLEYDQIKQAMGAAQYDQVFAGQAHVPSVLDRITNPALNPDLVGVVNSILAHPQAGLTALWNNLPLAVNDVVLPVVLAVSRVELLAYQTMQAIKADVTSGQFTQLPADLVNAVKGIGTIINQTLTDPATSVTAGLLNARDDLATAVTNAVATSTTAAATASTAAVPTPVAAKVNSVSATAVTAKVPSVPVASVPVAAVPTATVAAPTSVGAESGSAAPAVAVPSTTTVAAASTSTAPMDTASTTKKSTTATVSTSNVAAQSVSASASAAEASATTVKRPDAARPRRATDKATGSVSKSHQGDRGKAGVSNK